ncbi:MAG: GNAT family N-acetyltransferase [Crocinitomicaceae bacterium]|nr:GNAT family N-acetyltransferase [Crocinitomicaceae bacterium]
MVSVYSAKEKNLSASEIQTLYEIIIKAYADTEYQMWGMNYVRVTLDDFQKFIEADQILVEFLNNKIAGGIRYYPLDQNTYSFGLFGADFSLSGKGIGRKLIEAVELQVTKSGGTSIKIEILRPRDFEIPIKTKLHDWYQKLGYAFVESIPFEEKFPERAKGILVPCMFDYYEKKLV